MFALCRPLTLAVLLLTIALLNFCDAANAQSAVPAPIIPAKTRLGKTASPRKTVYATVAAVNGSAATLTLDGENETAPLAACLTPKTKFYRPQTRAATPGFLVGERVVVRVEMLAPAPNPRASVLELWDVALYEEQQKRRKELSLGTVRQTLVPGAPSGFLLIEDPDGAPVTFRVTEKTMFRKGGVPVAPSAYPPGSEAAVKPRALPSGGLMASIVAETEAQVEIHYKDTLSTWEGTVLRVDVPAGYFVLRRSDGVERNVAFPTDFRVTDEKTRKETGVRRTYMLGELQTLPVKVRLVRGERPGSNGARTAVEVTVDTAGTGEPRPGKAGTGTTAGKTAPAEPR